jgi:SMC interacting uncharacterized protein involved in chromosome segregation
MKEKIKFLGSDLDELKLELEKEEVLLEKVKDKLKEKDKLTTQIQQHPKRNS